MFFDSHCHLTCDELAPSFEAVIERARANGVDSFLNIGDDLASSRQAVAQAQRAEELGVRMWTTAGVHPQKAQHYSWDPEKGTAAEIRQLAAHSAVRAIGEIGLDFVYDETHPDYTGATRAVQDEVLRDQLRLSGELALPVVLHNRAADGQLLQVLHECREVITGGVLHCFGSPLEVARRALDMGLYLGFTGLVTFKNAEGVRDAARFCPLDRLLIETDSPYLAPVPHRGKTNEPAHLPMVARTVAQLHGVSVERMAELTTENALRLFGLEEAR